jgi:hypothetical protein
MFVFRNTYNLIQKSFFVGLFLFSFGLQNHAFGQQDFNNFKTLVASGNIPSDFTTRTSDKIETDIAGNKIQLNSTAKEKEFLEGVHTQIDNLLLSGSVIYGDEISDYVKSVAANLLKDEPELLAQLRFYTIKSNETNALSTDQGIVFVTTGLITQLTSEAQLAYVLSHEIAHYTERHVLQSYELSKGTINKRNQIEKLSSHSKENELEADRLALKRYHAAGYSADEIIATFDVLMYSYLPFDDVEFSRSYFNTESLYIPESLFGDKEYEIKAEEDYNDLRSSHPNIKKRKDAILQAMEHYSDWGAEVNTFGAEKFNYIRSVSRFESLRTNIMNVELAQAIYSVYLLEQEYKSSEYLDRTKALIWLSMIQLNNVNDLTSNLPNSSDYEGESGNLYFMLRKLSDEQLMTIGLRTIYDLKKSHPDDEFYTNVYDRLLKSLAGNTKFKLERYSTKGFHQAATEAKTPLNGTGSDSLSPEAPKSKYDKIKNQKKSTSIEAFDSTNFALYAIPDIIRDSSFLDRYNHFKKSVDSIQEIEDYFDELSYQDRKKVLREEARTADNYGFNLQKYVLVEPTMEYNKKSINTALEKEMVQDKYQDALLEANDKVGLEVTLINRSTLATSGTDGFNERNAYISYLEESANYPEIELFPVDYELLKELTASHGTSKLLFTTVNYSFEPNINPLYIVYSALFFPTLPLTLLIYMPIQLATGQQSVYSTLVLDTNTGIPLSFDQDMVHSKPNKRISGAYYYHLLNKYKNMPR